MPGGPYRAAVFASSGGPPQCRADHQCDSDRDQRGCEHGFENATTTVCVEPKPNLHPARGRRGQHYSQAQANGSYGTVSENSFHSKIPRMSRELTASRSAPSGAQFVRRRVALSHVMQRQKTVNASTAFNEPQAVLKWSLCRANIRVEAEYDAM
jgi:hypothetical protein